MRERTQMFYPQSDTYISKVPPDNTVGKIQCQCPITLQRRRTSQHPLSPVDSLRKPTLWLLLNISNNTQLKPGSLVTLQHDRKRGRKNGRSLPCSYKNTSLNADRVLDFLLSCTSGLSGALLLH